MTGLRIAFTTGLTGAFGSVGAFSLAGLDLSSGEGTVSGFAGGLDGAGVRPALLFAADAG
jgi:hypothetical protein